MKKVLVWLLALGGGFIVLLLAAILLVPRFIDVESYLPKIEQKVTEQTGRSFAIGKDVEISVFPWVGASFSDLELGNPEQFGEGDFLKVKSFEARVKLLPLLSREIVVDKFVLNGPEIHLVKKKDGTVNWAFAGKGAAAEPKEPAVSEQEKKEETRMGISGLQVGEFAVTNGSLVYEDRASGQAKTVADINFRLEDVSLDNPIGVDFNALVEGKPLSMQGMVGPIGKTPGRGTIKLDLKLQALKQLAVNLSGEIIEPASEQKFKLDLNVSSFSPRKVFEILEIPMPVKTSDPSVLGKLEAKLKVQGDPASITVSNSSLVLDDSKLQIEARIKDMARPDIAFMLNLDGINLDRYLPPAEEKKQKTAGKPKKAAKKEPAVIDYAPLRQLVLDGEVKVGKLVAGGATVTNVLLKMTGKNGIFNLDPFKLDLYQGSLAVLGNFNVQKDKPVSRIDFTTSNVQVGPLLQESINKDILRGAMNGFAKLSFVGDNDADIKKSLNGVGDLKFLDGAIVGIDIAGTVRNIKSGLANAQQPVERPTTDFAELNVPFKLVNGVFQTQETSLLSPLLRVKAAGSANLVTEKLDMKVNPKIVGTLKGQGDTQERGGLSVPLLVKGTFAEPQISADMTALVNEKTIQEAITNPDSLKEKAKSLEETGKNLLKGFGFGD